MKKLFTGLMVAVVAMTTSGCDLFADPVAYNDQLNELNEESVGAFFDFGMALGSGGDADALEAERVEALEIVEGVRDQVAALEDFGGNTDFRDSVVDLQELYIEVLEEDVVELIDMYRLDASEVDMNKVIEFATSITEKEEAALEKVNAAQVEFADENNMLLY